MDTSLTLGCAVPQDFCHTPPPLGFTLSDADFAAKLAILQAKAPLSLGDQCLLELMQTLRPHLVEQTLDS